MILFKQDWRHYPRAIVDTKTRNASFLKLAAVYRAMGIDHYYMILALHNPDIQGLDPFDPNLTEQQKEDIAYECKTNPWYHLREVARLPPSSGIEPIAYMANRGNIALTWCFLCHITAMLIQPRQTGKSGSVDILTDWVIDIAGNHTKMLMITKDSALQSDAISRLKGMRELLPAYIYSKHKLDSDNKTGMDNTALSNEFKTGVARANKLAANNLGRGLTTAILHIDEGPFITHIAATLPAAQAAGTKAREFAEKNGALYGTIFTTTAGRRDDRDGGYMYDYISKGMVWNEVLFDCRDRFDAYKMVDRACKKDSAQIVNITMSHRQLGLSDEWLFKAIRQSAGTREEVERDFLNIWNSGSQRSPLSAELMQKIHASSMDPLTTEVTADNYIVKWYITDSERQYLRSNSRLVMGMDSSEASGRDAIALTIMDVATLQVVGAATVGLANLIEFAKWLAAFLVEHDDITLIPERKSTGQMIVDMLLIMLPQAGVDPFKRIYNTVVEEGKASRKGEEEYLDICGPLSSRDDFFYTERKTKFGFFTTKPKRDMLYGNTLQQAAKQSASMIRDKTLITEIMGLTVKNERIDHSHLGHDDHVFAWLLGHWFVNQAMNLSHYGIPAGLVMSALVESEEEEKSVGDRWKDHVQRAYMEEIDKLIITLGDCENEALVGLYERKLQFLSRKVESSGNVKDFSVDGIMDKVRREREKRQRLSNAVGTVSPEAEARNRVLDVISTYQNNRFRAMPGGYQSW
jgi:hypothetical protein